MLTEKQPESCSFTFYRNNFCFEIICGNDYEFEDWLNVLKKIVVFLGFTK